MVPSVVLPAWVKLDCVKQPVDGNKWELAYPAWAHTHNMFKVLVPPPSPTMSSIHSLAIKPSLTGDCDPDRSLMKAYRDFGLHQLAPSVLVTTVGCDDSRFSSDRLYNKTEKVYPKPTG